MYHNLYLYSFLTTRKLSSILLCSFTKGSLGQPLIMKLLGEMVCTFKIVLDVDKLLSKVASVWTSIKGEYPYSKTFLKLLLFMIFSFAN